MDVSSLKTGSCPSARTMFQKCVCFKREGDRLHFEKEIELRVLFIFNDNAFSLVKKFQSTANIFSARIGFSLHLLTGTPTEECFLKL